MTNSSAKEPDLTTPEGVKEAAKNIALAICAREFGRAEKYRRAGREDQEALFSSSGTVADEILSAIASLDLPPQWRDISEVKRDSTVLVAVRRRNGQPIIRDEMASTHPAYIDEDGRFCDAGSWSPDKGLHGDHFEAFAFMPLPSPPTDGEKK